MANPPALLVVLAVAFALMLGTPSTAAAEVDPTTPGTNDGGSSVPTHPETGEPVPTHPETGEPLPTHPETGDTLAPGETLPGDTSTTDPSTTDTTSSDSTTGESTTTSLPDGSTTTLDPLHEEEPGEEAPETEETVPEPKGAYAGQGSYQPAEVLWSSVRAAEGKVAAAQATRDALQLEIAEVRSQHRRLLDEQAALGDEAETAADEISEAETTLRRRAIAGFMHDDALENAVLGSLQASEHDTILDFGIRQRFLRALLDQDDEAIGDYLELRSEIDADVLAGIDEIRDVQTAIRDLDTEILAAEAEIEQAEAEAAAFRAGSEIYIDGIVFPIGDGYGLPLIDSFGFPRMPGTPDEHWHEGIDIFAPAGTPLLATERGIITRVGSGRLGGLTVWIKGESGAAWYYAHLRSHAEGIHEGMVVEAGDLVGYVGNTGNAISTPPHLHMEVHPNGGEPVNPYPLLKAISDRDLANG